MKTPAQKRYLVLIVMNLAFALICFATLVAGWFYLVNISKETSKLYTESKFLGRESTVISDTITKYNKVSDYKPVVLEALPTTKEVSSFIADVSKIAASDSIKITQSTLSSGDAKSKNSDPAYSQTVSKGDYNELQIKYTVEGSYQNFLKMLGDLRSLRRLNNISEVIISKAVTDVTGDNVTVSFTDSIFIKK